MVSLERVKYHVYEIIHFFRIYLYICHVYLCRHKSVASESIIVLQSQSCCLETMVLKIKTARVCSVNVLVLNDVARVVTKTAYREHIKPSLYRLHWLPVKERIDFKLSTLVHKSINSFLPAYLSDQISFYQPSRNLRSSNQLRLNVPWTRTKLAERSFAVAASRIWNNLPLDITMLSSQSINIFKSNLKTHFFKIAYKDFIH